MEKIIKMTKKKPNFLIVGAAKAGTTSLAKYLNQHPDIFIPEEKELRYFVKNHLQEVSQEDPSIKNILKNSILNKDDYYAKFQVKESVRGEASVHYLFEYEEAIPKIKEELGDIPIIIILRKPIDRIISHVKYLNFHFNYSFNEELELEQKRIKEKYNSFWYYKSLSFYSHQIKAYMNNFSDVKVYLFEDFKNDPQTILSDIFKIFNVYDIKFDSFEVYNKSSVLKNRYKYLRKFKWIFPEKINSSLGNYFLKNLYEDKEMNVDHESILKLKNMYEDDISRLEKILGVSLENWKK